MISEKKTKKRLGVRKKAGNIVLDHTLDLNKKPALEWRRIFLY